MYNKMHACTHRVTYKYYRFFYIMKVFARHLKMFVKSQIFDSIRTEYLFSLHTETTYSPRKPRGSRHQFFFYSFRSSANARVRFKNVTVCTCSE